MYNNLIYCTYITSLNSLEKRMSSCREGNHFVDPLLLVLHFEFVAICFLHFLDHTQGTLWHKWQGVCDPAAKCVPSYAESCIHYRARARAS